MMHIKLSETAEGFDHQITRGMPEVDRFSLHSLPPPVAHRLGKGMVTKRNEPPLSLSLSLPPTVYLGTPLKLAKPKKLISKSSGELVPYMSDLPIYNDTLILLNTCNSLPGDNLAFLALSELKVHVFAKNNFTVAQIVNFFCLIG